MPGAATMPGMTEPEPQRRFANAFARAALALPRGVSPGLARRLAPGLGSVLYRLDPARGKVLENLELALGGELNPSEREALARRFYAHLVLLTCEISWMSRWSAEQITSRYENRGAE